MNYGNSDWRQRRNILNTGVSIHPMQYNIANYSTSAMKDPVPFDIKPSLEDGNIIARFPDLLKKNLADSVINTEEKNQKNKKMSLEEAYQYENPTREEESKPEHRHDFYHSLTGIAGFFSNFFGAISGAMFHKRPKSPASQYYDCCDHEFVDDRQGAPEFWHQPNNQDQNKSGWPGEQFSSGNDGMNNCRAAAAHCEDKLNAVRTLLVNKTVQNPQKKQPVRLRRPRKVFVEPGAVEDNFEDAFSPEDFVSLAKEECIEYYTVCNNPTTMLCEVDAPKVKTEPIRENTDIVKDMPVCVFKDNFQQVAKKLSQLIKIDNKTGMVTVNTTDKPIDIVPKTVEVTDTSKTKLPENVSDSKLQTETKATPEIQVTTENIPQAVNNSLNVPCATPQVKCEEKTPVVNTITPTQEITSSCEDKMAQLKWLLEKRKKPATVTETTDSTTKESPKQTDQETKEDHHHPTHPKTIPINKVEDKHFKNPHRLSRPKRQRTQMRKNIQDDMLFAHEIDSEEISSVENSPKCRKQYCKELKLSATPDSSDDVHFDEIKGRFHSTSTTDSEDSFQIVFSDNPQRVRRPSDCESEDSFIVFEDPDCYTTNDVFGDESDDESSSDDDIEVCKLAHSFSRTIADLTDGSLYDGDYDELDCAVKMGDGLDCVKICDDEVTEVEGPRGLLVNEARKLKKKDDPPKKVTFSSAPPTVRVMRVWAYAARQARAGHWETHARDRERFKRRIADADMALSWVLKPQHRSRVMFQRFMPWWNQQKRKEIAEKKQRAEEKRLKKEREEQERLDKEAEDQKEDGKEEVEEKEVEDGDENKVDDTGNINHNTDMNEDVKVKETPDTNKININDTIDTQIINNSDINSTLVNSDSKIVDNPKPVGNNNIVNQNVGNVVNKNGMKTIVDFKNVINEKVLDDINVDNRILATERKILTN